ncbi:malate:quinone oxidoreductase [Rathayibacter sp. VKM Ac-2801]|uniref:malate:quinone oxidoreductase n=1 Tax=Rathayibacter sp. VKM Ac-2801 TaxID=2609255 RepID=UPI001320310B|nr:malate:quinone oxidoreductase [Rathayibacter sp. VKM Ac-2801]QHC71838.1 hypothetical protein GSU45_16540 [Rathayibacter sp. VKM Ac-2801]
MTASTDVLLVGRRSRISTLCDVVPVAESDDWELITAGRRVQVMKSEPSDAAVSAPAADPG